MKDFCEVANKSYVAAVAVRAACRLAGVPVQRLLKTEVKIIITDQTVAEYGLLVMRMQQTLRQNPIANLACACFLARRRHQNPNFLWPSQTRYTLHSRHFGLGLI